jgi:hypothetical protein
MYYVSKTTVTSTTPAIPGPPSPPERIAGLLRVVRILLGYGRHLADTVTHRATAPSFTSIAACFGTINLSVILARLHRGILRAAALERLLLARAAAGRDIEFTAPRTRGGDSRPAPTNQPAGQPAPRSAAPRPPRRFPWIESDGSHIPTPEEVERQVRRRPLGRTIVDICLDLAVMPGLCTGPFWNELFEIMQCYGGSIAALMRERCRREEVFDREQDGRPRQGWDWLRPGRDMVRQALGFFIGEEPVFPSSPPCALAPAAALATGPP